MANDVFVRLLTALLKHQFKKLVGGEALGVIGEELTALGGDKLSAWFDKKDATQELERAAALAEECFLGKVNDHELEQWMRALPISNLPTVLQALDELQTASDESKLDKAIRDSIALSWGKLSAEQVEYAVSTFMSCLRRALLPLERQQFIVIGRSVLRTEEKISELVSSLEIYQAIRQKDYSLSPSLAREDKKRQLKIFLCHSSLDKTRVREIYAQLVNRGFDPWLDERNILPGQNWRQVIKKAISSSDTVIVCLSRASISRAGYVHKEVSMALDVAEQQPENSIFVIPLRLDDCEVPDRLSHMQWVDFFVPDSLNILVEALKFRLQELYLG